jgi:hypothetical protein
MGAPNTLYFSNAGLLKSLYLGLSNQCHFFKVVVLETGHEFLWCMCRIDVHMHPHFGKSLNALGNTLTVFTGEEDIDDTLCQQLVNHLLGLMVPNQHYSVSV